MKNNIMINIVQNYTHLEKPEEYADEKVGRICEKHP
jgi:hypothetical protein